MRKLYDGFDIDHEIEPSAWRETLRVFNEGAVEGLSEGGTRQHTPQFLQAIKHSNEVFSAFKCHSMGVKMAERLRDEEGNLRSFKEWKQAVRSIASHHVGAWLKTEYDTAILRAHQGSLWQEFERNRDIFPNLRWMPTTSPSPETVHEGYWSKRLTLPIDDPFWQDNHPANRWNCKCSLEATDDKADTGHIAELARQEHTAQRGLENNPRDGHLFSDKHPYFPSKCSDCPFYRERKGKLNNLLGGLFRNRSKDCYQCIDLDLKIDIAKGYAPPEVETYKVLHHGQVLVSPYHGANELDENVRLAKFVSDKLHERVYLLPRLDPLNPEQSKKRPRLLPNGVFDKKNPDFLIKGKIYDGKVMEVGDPVEPRKQKSRIENKIKSAKEQAENIIIEVPPHYDAEVIDATIKNYKKRSSVERSILIKHGNELYVY